MLEKYIVVAVDEVYGLLKACNLKKRGREAYILHTIVEYLRMENISNFSCNFTWYQGSTEQCWCVPFNFFPILIIFTSPCPCNGA